MKKILLLAILSLSCMSLMAQKQTKTYDMKGFRSVDISGIYKVTLVQSDNFFVEVESIAEVFPYLEIKVKDNTLYLGVVSKGFPAKNIFKDVTMEARVGMPSLNEVEMSGVTTLYLEDAFSSPSFNFDLSGVSKAFVNNLSCTDLNIEISGASKMTFTGTAETADVEISGASSGEFDFGKDKLTFMDAEISGTSQMTIFGSSIRSELECSGVGKYNGKDFKADAMLVNVSGASKAEVNCGSLDFSVTGAAKLRYANGTKITNMQVSGAGSVMSY